MLGRTVVGMQGEPDSGAPVFGQVPVLLGVLVVRQPAVSPMTDDWQVTSSVATSAPPSGTRQNTHLFCV